MGMMQFTTAILGGLLVYAYMKVEKFF